MAPQHISLDPTFPLCWENMETLRIGFDRVEARVHSPTPAAQRFIGQLRSGLRSSDLAGVARNSGLSTGEQEQLLQQLSPVLVYSPAPDLQICETNSPSTTFAVLGEGIVARGVRAHFEQAGFPLAQDGTTPGFAIVVQHFLGTTFRPQSLLSDDVPHLPIRVTDRHLYLGPLILPGGMPCLTCVELHSLDEEPTLHILAAQLANDIPAAATAHSIDLVSSSAIAVTRLWQRGNTELAGVRLSYTVHRGLPFPIPGTEKIIPHSECGCVLLSQPE